MAVTYPLILPGPPASIRIRRRVVVGGNISGTSLVPQTYRWGGDRWELSIAFPPMSAATAAPWDAVLTALDGPHGSFLWGSPRWTAPFGTATGSPTVQATTADRSRTLPITGGSGTLLKGSRFSIGSGLTRRMYTVLNDVTLGGTVTLDIWPSLRGQATSGTAIALTNPTCLFMLALGSVVDSGEDQAGNIRFEALQAWEDLR